MDTHCLIEYAEALDAWLTVLLCVSWCVFNLLTFFPQPVCLLCIIDLNLYIVYSLNTNQSTCIVLLRLMRNPLPYPQVLVVMLLSLQSLCNCLFLICYLND